AVGKSLPAQQQEGKPPVNLTYVSCRNLTTGEVQEYSTAEPYPWDDPNFEHVANSTRVVELEPGIDSQVQDFMLFNAEGDDLTDEVLSASGPVLLIVAKTINDTRTDCRSEERRAGEE